MPLGGDSFLIERRQLEDQMIALSRRVGVGEEELARAARFNGLCMTDLVYVEYGTGERELYDLGADPHQLSNLAATTDPAAIVALSSRLAELADCAGARCREIEDLPARFDLRLMEEGLQPVPASVSGVSCSPHGAKRNAAESPRILLCSIRATTSPVRASLAF